MKKKQQRRPPAMERTVRRRTAGRMPRRTHRRTRALSLAAMAGAGILCFEDNALTVSAYIYRSEKVDPSLAGYRILQISDLHNKSFGPGNQRLLTRISDCEPDCIVITGDLVDRRRTRLQTAFDFVDAAVKIAPVYYVTGNHEWLMSTAKYHRLLSGLAARGVVFLEDRMVSLRDHLCLAGVSARSIFAAKDPDLAARGVPVPADGMLEKAPRDALKVLLAHEPQLLPRYARAGADIVFCGHAHGGQVRIPGTGIGLFAPEQGILPAYSAGAYQHGTTTMYVSRGLGNSLFPWRIFNRPEIVVTELQPEHD
ncbi:MAG: metallophosphoesterase [Anaerovoracaceae bacterium]